MKNILGIVVSLLLITGCHTSKNPVRYSLEGDDEPVNMSQLKRQYPGESGVYLYYKHDIAHDLKPDFTNNAPRWYFFESYHWKEVLINTPEGTDEETPLLVVDLAEQEELRALTVRVVYPDATVAEFTRRDLKKAPLGGDSTRYQLLAPHVQGGTTLETAYEIERKNLYDRPPVSHDVPLQLDKPVLDFTFAYTYPWSWDIQIKEAGAQNTVEFVETRQKRPETITLQYEAASIPSFKEEAYGPYFKQVAPYFHVQVQRLEVGNVLRYEAPDAWETIATRYARYAEVPAGRLSAKAQQVLDELGVREAQPEAQRLSTIHAHLQQDIQAGPSGKVDDVFKQQRGNSFAVATYARALLSQAGLEADYLVSHSAEGGYFDEAFITNQQLYRPVLQVNSAGQSHFIFPGLTGVPNGYIPVEYSGQPAMMFSEGGFDGFTTLPQTASAAYTDKGTYDLFINADGEVRAKARLAFGLHSTYRLNKARHNAKDGEEAEIVRQLLPHPKAAVSGLQYRMVEDAQRGETTIVAEYGLEGCLRSGEEQVVLNDCGLFDAYTASWYPFDQPRTTPLFVTADMAVEKKITVTYPATWSLETPISDESDAYDQGHFKRSVGESEGQLQVAQRLTIPHYTGPFAPGVVSASYRLLPQFNKIDALTLSTIQQVAVVPFEDGYVGGPWTLVLNSFDNLTDALASADAYQQQLNPEGYRVKILNIAGEESEFRVVAGVFETRKSLETAKIKLGDGIPYDTWMLSIKPQMTAVTGESDPTRQ